jgi:hypothetical protein
MYSSLKSKKFNRSPNKNQEIILLSKVDKQNNVNYILNNRISSLIFRKFISLYQTKSINNVENNQMSCLQAYLEKYRNLDKTFTLVKSMNDYLR